MSLTETGWQVNQLVEILMCKLLCKNINKYNLKNNIFILKHSVRWRERERDEERGGRWREGRQVRGRKGGGEMEGGKKGRRMNE